MKFIRVSSEDSDFGAEIFEQSEYFTKEGMKKLWEDAYEHSITLNLISTVSDDSEEENVEVTVEALSFKDVDPDFVSFVKNEMFDYDFMKADNIYPVEE